MSSKLCPSDSNMDSDSICDSFASAPNTCQTGSSDSGATDRPKLPSAPPLVSEASSANPPSSNHNRDQDLYPHLPPMPSDDHVSYSSLTDERIRDIFDFVAPASLPVADDYSRQVTRIGTINYSRRKVMGMALHCDKLYVVHYRSNVICQYDITRTEAAAFIVPPVSHGTVSGLSYPRGLAVNPRSGRLFLTDRRRILGRSKSGRIWNVTPDGAVLAYADFDMEPFGVSIGHQNHRILVACVDNTQFVSVPFLGVGHIVIFEDMNGKLVQQDRISLGESVALPRFVIEAPTVFRPNEGKEYLVVHGWTRLPGLESHHQVIRVNVQGRVLSHFGTGHGSEERQLDRPVSLCLDDSDKMFVADCFNDRVLLLTRTPSSNHDLDLVRPLVTSANGISRPRHVCLDKSKRLLYVGQDTGRIGVFLVGRQNSYK